MCVPHGLVVELSPGSPKGPSSNLGSTFFSSLLFFSFLFFSFFFSFSFHFRYNSFVMFLYIAHNFWLTNFLLGFTCRSPKSFAGSCDLRISSSYVVRLMVPIFLVHISETTCPLPSKVRRRGHATPLIGSWLYVRHFVFFGRGDLPPQHVWLCHRSPNNNNNRSPHPPPQKKRKLEFTQDYSLHFILP